MPYNYVYIPNIVIVIHIYTWLRNIPIHVCLLVVVTTDRDMHNYYGCIIIIIMIYLSRHFDKE